LVSFWDWFWCHFENGFGSISVIIFAQI